MGVQKLLVKNEKIMSTERLCEKEVNGFAVSNNIDKFMHASYKKKEKRRKNRYIDRHMDK